MGSPRIKRVFFFPNFSEHTPATSGPMTAPKVIMAAIHVFSNVVVGLGSGLMSGSRLLSLGRMGEVQDQQPPEANVIKFTENN